MANARKYGYIKPAKKEKPARLHKPGNFFPGKKRLEVDRNAKTLGKQFRV